MKDFENGSVSYFDDEGDVGVVTIDESSSRPIAKGTVRISIQDDENNPIDVVLKNCLLFPNSPVKVLSITELAKQFNDHEGTWIKTCWSHSTFTWDHDQHTISFRHPESKLPVLYVHSVTASTLASFASLIEHSTLGHDIPPMTTSRSCLPMDDLASICFATDQISDNGVSKFHFPDIDLTHDLPIKGDRVRYIKDEHTEIVDVVGVSLDSSTNVHYFEILLHDGHTLKVTRDFIFPLDYKDIALLPLSKEHVENHIEKLDAETLEALINPTQPTALLKEFMSWHIRCGHIPFYKMFQLCRKGFLPKKFLELEHKKLICPSCVLGKQRRRAWRSKAEAGSLRSEATAEVGSRVSLDNVVSAQPGLVPRMDGRHTKERIHGGCCFIDNHSKYSYTHLQTSIDIDQTLEAKHGFEHHAATCGVVEVSSYHADNDIFAEKGVS